MHTTDKASEAVSAAIHSVLDGNVPSFDHDTTLASLGIDPKECDYFAQVVSDSLALLPNSEAEVHAIICVETTRKPGDTRAMSVAQLIERVAALPVFEG